MKKVISTILIVLTILFCSSYVLGTTGKVTADTLNVRESASQSAKVIARIAKDQKVEILEDNGEWLKIKYRSYTGYVSSKFITKDAETETGTTTTTEEKKEETETKPEEKAEEKTEEKKEEPKQVVEENKTQKTEYITNRETKLKENVKVYSLPTLSSYTVGDINSGTNLLVINSAGQWAYVQTDSLSGWIKLAATEIEVAVVEPEPKQEEPKEEPKTEEPVVQNTVEEKPTENTETTTPEEPKQEEPAPSTDNGSYPKTMYTNKSSVIIRYKPSKDSGILNSLNKGAKVKVIGKEGEWYKVSISGDTGYIYYTLLSDSAN